MSPDKNEDGNHKNCTKKEKILTFTKKEKSSHKFCILLTRYFSTFLGQN